MNRTLYCKKKKCTISFKDCANCEFKEYKIPINDNLKNKNLQKCEKNYKKTKKNVIFERNTNKRNRPSKRTKATSITKATKLIVWERDNKRCIFCHKQVEWNLANSHFIKRSHGGLGIPKNIFTACLECHHKFDDTPLRKDMLPIAENYLKSKHGDWNKDDLIYKK